MDEAGHDHPRWGRQDGRCSRDAAGSEREKVLKQAKSYLDETLRLRIPAEDAVSVRAPDPNAPEGKQQYTGALIYPYLADQATGSVGDDLQVFDDIDQFNQQKAKEDGVLAP